MQAVTIRQMSNRLDRLEPLLVDAGEPYDPTLAAQWTDAAAARCHELGNKAEALTDGERMELAHLKACQEAWTRKHWPWEGEGDGTRWSDENHERFYRLVLKTYLNPSYPHPEPLGWDPLTLEERAELEGIKKRQLPLDPNDPLAAFNVPGLTAAYRAMLERKSVSTAEFYSWREYLLDPWKAAGYAVGFMAPGPDVPKEVRDKILGLDPLADSFKAFRHAAARADAAHRE